MAAKWVDWPNDQCPVCGGDMQVRTSAPPAADGSPQCHDDDSWKCEDGHHGGMGVTEGEGEDDIGEAYVREPVE